jgi:hypothetical protein
MSDEQRVPENTNKLAVADKAAILIKYSIESFLEIYREDIEKGTVTTRGLNASILSALSHILCQCALSIGVEKDAFMKSVEISWDSAERISQEEEVKDGQED